MQVHHDEEVANRIDPESCAAAREGISEALTGDRTGQELSRESTLDRGAGSGGGARVTGRTSLHVSSCHIGGVGPGLELAWGYTLETRERTAYRSFPQGRT